MSLLSTLLLEAQCGGKHWGKQVSHEMTRLPEVGHKVIQRAIWCFRGSNLLLRTDLLVDWIFLSSCDYVCEILRIKCNKRLQTMLTFETRIELL